MSVVSPQHCERINTCSTIAGAPDQPWRLRELTNRCPPILVEIITHFNEQHFSLMPVSGNLVHLFNFNN